MFRPETESWYNMGRIFPSRMRNSRPKGDKWPFYATIEGWKWIFYSSVASFLMLNCQWHTFGLAFYAEFGGVSKAAESYKNSIIRVIKIIWYGNKPALRRWNPWIWTNSNRLLNLHSTSFFSTLKRFIYLFYSCIRIYA